LEIKQQSGCLRLARSGRRPGEQNLNDRAAPRGFRNAQDGLAGRVPRVEVGAFFEEQPHDGLPAGLGGDHQSRIARAAFSVDVRSVVEQSPYHARAAFCSRAFQGGIGLGAPHGGKARNGFGSGALAKERAHAHAGLVAAFRGKEQSGLSVPVFGVGIGAFVEQGLDHGAVAACRGVQQSGHSQIVLCVGVSPLFEQSAHDARLASRCGVPQDSRAADALRIRIGASSEQNLRDVDPIPAYGMSQGGQAGRALDVDIGALRDQRFRDRRIGGRHQCRESGAPHRIDVRALGEQIPDPGEIALRRRVHQLRPAEFARCEAPRAADRALSDLRLGLRLRDLNRDQRKREPREQADGAGSD
jgi:hypothetical protein